MRKCKKIIGDTPKRELFFLAPNFGIFKERIVNYIQDLHDQVLDCIDVINTAEIRDGVDGVGIKSIEVSVYDQGKANKLRFILTNNNYYDFVVYNGINGAKGDKGDKGAKGDDATINGYNTILIESGNCVNVTQEGNRLVINVVTEDISYADLKNLPTINNVEIKGSKTLVDLGIASISDIPDVSNFITKSVNDLTYYYLKSETYTKDEVASLIGAIRQFSYEVAASTSAVTDPQSSVLYLIGPTGSGSDKYEEYVYPNSTIGWTKIGDTSIDLTGYVTTNDLNTALANYTTTSDLTTLLGDINDNIQALKVPLASTIPSGGMLPNVVYNLGTLSSNTTFTLAAPTDNTILNHYYWTFNTGSTVPTITWPTGIIWAGDNLTPTIVANKHYEVSVINNVATYIDSPLS